jgi:hypothetical protein
MLKNASVGEYVFWIEVKLNVSDLSREGTFLARSLVVEKGEYPPPGPKHEGKIYEEKLNSLGRFRGPIICENEVARHETEYMKQNSDSLNYT